MFKKPLAQNYLDGRSETFQQTFSDQVFAPINRESS